MCLLQFARPSCASAVYACLPQQLALVQPAAAPAAGGGAVSAPPAPSAAEQAAMLRSVSMAHNAALFASDLDSSDLREELIQLRQSYTILLLGNMGAGKTSLINAVVGAAVMPMSPPGMANQQTDTMCLVEICNEPELAPGTFQLSVVLKEPRAWKEDWSAFLSTVTPDAFNVAPEAELDIGLGDEGMADVAAASPDNPAVAAAIGAEFGTDMLRALHARCFDPVDATERDKVLQYLAARVGNEAALLSLANDDGINAVLALRTVNVQLNDASLLSDLLAHLCRSFSSRDASRQQRLHSAFHHTNPELLQLLGVGDPWPLVRLVSVAGNLSDGVLPPFCRLIDSPGLGGDTSMTGVDTFSFIKRCLHDRILSEVWYVSGFSRDVATTTLKDMDQLGQLIGQEHVRFVVTQSDMSNVLVDNNVYRTKLMVKATDIQHKSGIPLMVAAQQTLFVSAMGHAYHRGIQLPGLDMYRATIQQNVKNVQQARITALVKQLTHRVWRHIDVVHRARCDFITTHLRALTQLGVAPPAQPNVAPADTNALVVQQLDASSQALGAVVNAFNTSMMVLAGRVQQHAVCTALTNAVVGELSKLMSQTVKAVLRRGGCFSGRGAGSADASVSVWREFLTQPVGAAAVAPAAAAAVALRFGDACDQLFRDATTAFQQGLTALAQTLVQQAGAEQGKIDAAQRGLAQAVARHLYQLRQEVTLRCTVADALEHVSRYQAVWAGAHAVYCNTVRGGKGAAAITHVQHQLPRELPASIHAATSMWVQYVAKQLRAALEEELEKLAAEVHTSIQLQVQDARPLLELLLGYAAQFPPTADLKQLLQGVQLRLQQLQRAQPTAPLPQLGAGAGAAGAAAGAHSRLQDRRWIMTSAHEAPALGDSVLLFRGLCAVDESRFQQPILGLPQQQLLRAMTSTVPADQLLANALASSSGAAIIEAILNTLNARHEGQLNIAQIDNALQELASWPAAQPIAQLLTADALNRAGVAVYDAVVACEPLQRTEREAWQRFINEWRKRHTPAENRQELYSSNTKSFLKGLEQFVRQLQPALADASEVDCPLGALDGGAEMRSWFHWRWLSPHRGLVMPFAPNLPQLHANPFVSSSQGLEHALKYAIGLKNYRTGQEKGVPVPLLYHADGRADVPNGAEPPLIGVVIVSQLSIPFVRDSPHLHVVLQMLERGVIKLPGGSKRIGSEAEVTLYGSLPQGNTRVLLRWPLPQPDLHQHNAVLRDVYGINADARGDTELHQLRVLAQNASASRAGETLFRQRLGIAAGHAITNHLLRQFNLVIGFDQQVLLR